MSKPPPTPKEVAEAWADRVKQLLDECERLRAVVAVQREALRECDAVIAVMTSYIDDLLDRARAANTPSLTHRDNAGPFGHYAQARLEELAGKVSALVVARAALDAEGVSEPGKQAGEEIGAAPLAEDAAPGSLTSPVDALRRADEAASRVHNYLRAIGEVTPDECEAAIWTIHDELRRIIGNPSGSPLEPPLTSPVDTAPRGYVTASADGPVGVYHAETPDTYLEHGDR